MKYSAPLSIKGDVNSCSEYTTCHTGIEVEENVDIDACHENSGKHSFLKICRQSLEKQKPHLSLSKRWSPFRALYTHHKVPGV